MRAATLANDATLTHNEDRWKVQGDPTEGALIVAARTAEPGLFLPLLAAQLLWIT